MMGRNLRSTIHGKEKEYEEFSETEGKKKKMFSNYKTGGK